MCRHLAWVGEPRTLASLIFEPEWSLLRQSFAPRRQDHGTVNADGFGICWYDEQIRPEPARYRRQVPMWTDASLRSLAPMIRAGTFAAFLRSTGVGMPIQETDTAPFVSGRWTFGLNGAASIESLIPLVEVGQRLDPLCDATLLATAVLGRLHTGAPSKEVRADEVLVDVVRSIVAADPAARLNMLVTDGRRVTATTCRGSLSYLHGTGLAAGGTLVASEPLDDDPGWVDVPDNCMLVADRSAVEILPFAEVP